MNLVELDHALRKLRLSGMADVVEARLRQAQTEKLAPIDLAFGGEASQFRLNCRRTHRSSMCQLGCCEF